MKDQVYRVEYFAITVDDQPGIGADLGRRLNEAGVNLLALSAFPLTAGKTQVDIVPEHPEPFLRAAKTMKLTLGGPKVAFLIQGTDRPGAMGEVLGRLGAATGRRSRATGLRPEEIADRMVEEILARAGSQPLVSTMLGRRDSNRPRETV